MTTLDGLRMTQIRKHIIDFFLSSKHPLTARDMMKIIPANKTTIYREIETLLSRNFLTKVDFGDGIKRYEAASRDHHHHLVCVECKSVSDIDIADDFSQEASRIEAVEKFKVLKHNLEFFGLCQNCL